MAGVEELRNSLVTTIIRYHIKKTKSIRPLEEEQLRKMLNLNPQIMNNYLFNLIVESTSDDKNKTRLPLLMLLLETINALNAFIHEKEPLNERSASLIQIQLIDLVVGIQRLLITSQASEIAISSKDKTIMLYGFIGSLWTANAYCDSGLILQKTLFPTLKLTIDASKEEVTQTISEMVHHQQRDLQLIYLKQVNKTLNAQNEDLVSSIKSNEAEILLLKDKLDKTQSELNKAQMSLSQEKARNKSFSEATPPQYLPVVGSVVNGSILGSAPNCISVGYNPQARLNFMGGLMNFGLYKHPAMEAIKPKFTGQELPLVAASDQTDVPAGPSNACMV